MASTGLTLRRLRRLAGEHTQAEAARLVGVSRQRVNELARKHGLAFLARSISAAPPRPACHHCGCPHDGPFSRCDACREAQKERDKAQRAEWREAGRCTRCGRTPIPGMLQCRQCVSNQRRRRRLRAKGRRRNSELPVHQ